MKRFRWLAIVVAVMVLGAVVCSVPRAYARAAQAGSLHITPSRNGEGVAYDAYRIAGDAALPQNDQLNWSALSGVSLDGRPAYPAYDPASATATADGRALVERVSEDVLSDDAGVLAYALRAYVPQGARPAVRVVAGGPSVAVEDGWYLLTAAGRRPLFAWVKGAAVELGDKSDTPVVSKQVNAGAGWSDAALAGSGRVVSYRVDVSMPQAIEADRVYPLTVVDAWDTALTLAEDSLRVEVVASGNTAAPRDVTELVDLQVSGQEVTLFVANVHDLGVDLGDVLRLTYTMSLDPYAQLGAAGAVNSAHAVFPSWTGQETTPRDEARVYALHIAIKKVNKAGDPLQDAVFALRTNEGWLAADGSFGTQSTRAEFTSNASGLVEGVPLLSDGSYELVELQAPKGYRKLDADGVPFELSAATADGRLAYNARATKPLRVVDVDAASVTAHLELVNEKAGGLLDSLIPQTGDSAWVLGAAAVAAAGCAVLLMGMRRTRRRG